MVKEKSPPLPRVERRSSSQ